MSQKVIISILSAIIGLIIVSGLVYFSYTKGKESAVNSSSSVSTLAISSISSVKLTSSISSTISSTPSTVSSQPISSIKTYKKEGFSLSFDYDSTIWTLSEGGQQSYYVTLVNKNDSSKITYGIIPSLGGQPYEVQSTVDIGNGWKKGTTLNNNELLFAKVSSNNSFNSLRLIEPEKYLDYGIAGLTITYTNFSNNLLADEVIKTTTGVK